MKFLNMAMVSDCFSSSTTAKLVTRTVTYNQNGKSFDGFLAHDDSVTAKRPGVLVVHEWWGLNEYARKRTEELARMGYVAFAADMYGGGVTTSSPETAAEWAGEVKGSPLMRTRGLNALEQLRKNPHVDAGRIAAIGFCFGGTSVLELAWAGADLAGVVSFHGGLTSPKPEETDHIRAKVLVLHGAADPFETHKTVAGFQDALEKTKVDWRMVIYGKATHGFTNPEADSYHIEGLGYNKKAASLSWKQMGSFFNEIFDR